MKPLPQLIEMLREFVITYLQIVVLVPSDLNTQEKAKQFSQNAIA